MNINEESRYALQWRSIVEGVPVTEVVRRAIGVYSMISDAQLKGNLTVITLDDEFCELRIKLPRGKTDKNRE